MDTMVYMSRVSKNHGKALALIDILKAIDGFPGKDCEKFADEIIAEYASIRKAVLEDE